MPKPSHTRERAEYLPQLRASKLPSKVREP